MAIEGAVAGVNFSVTTKSKLNEGGEYGCDNYGHGP